MVGPDALTVCLAHWGLPVGFLLLRYSVLFTVESLSLFFFSFLYLDLYVLRDDALISSEVFHANHTSMRLHPHLN